MDHLLTVLKVARVGALAALSDYRTGAEDEAVVKDGGEVQLRGDRLASEEMLSAWRNISSQGPYIDEEDPNTHGLLLGSSDVTALMFDPIDGSSIYQLDRLLPVGAPTGGWGNTVGIIRHGQILAAAMHQPARNLVIYGTEETGCRWICGPSAYSDHLKDGGWSESQPFVQPQAPADANRKLVLSLPTSSKMELGTFEQYMDVRRDLQPLINNERSDGCAVANVLNVMFGMVDAYINVGGGLAWDLAVPFFLAELIGCKCTTLSGAPIVWTEKKQAVICARDEHTSRRILTAHNG